VFDWRGLAQKEGVFFPGLRPPGRCTGRLSQLPVGGLLCFFLERSRKKKNQYAFISTPNHQFLLTQTLNVTREPLPLTASQSPTFSFILCTRKERTKKSARHSPALRVPSPARKMGATSLLLLIFPLASAAD